MLTALFFQIAFVLLLFQIQSTIYDILYLAILIYQLKIFYLQQIVLFLQQYYNHLLHLYNYNLFLDQQSDNMKSRIFLVRLTIPIYILLLYLSESYHIHTFVKQTKDDVSQTQYYFQNGLYEQLCVFSANFFVCPI